MIPLIFFHHQSKLYKNQKYDYTSGLFTVLYSIS